METKPKLILLPAVWAAETEIITFELNVLFFFAPPPHHTPISSDYSLQMLMWYLIF